MPGRGSKLLNARLGFALHDRSSPYSCSVIPRLYPAGSPAGHNCSCRPMPATHSASSTSAWMRNMPMPRGPSSPCILRSMSGLATCPAACSCPVPSSITFTSSESALSRQHHAHAQLFVQPVAVLDGVDAGLGHGRLQVFDAVLAEAHQLGHRRRGAHGHLLEAHARGQPHLDRGGLGHAVGVNSLMPASPSRLPRGTAPVRSCRLPAARLPRIPRWPPTMHREYHRPCAPGTLKMHPKAVRDQIPHPP